MRAVVVQPSGDDAAATLTEVPTQEPGPGQLRITVRAATVNPVDLASAAGVMSKAGLIVADEFGLGWDVAGVVDAVGPEVTGFAIGQPVVGLSDRLSVRSKAYAESIVLDADAVAAAPAGVPATAAATLPLNGLTAGQALDLLGLRAGQTLLVTGAAGGLGGFLVELAVLRGLRVVATAGQQDEEFVRGLGVEHFVPRSADLPAAVRALVPGGVDGAVDAAVVGGRALDAVRGGGAYVCVITGAAPESLRGITVHTVSVRADGAQLADLVRLAEAGTVSLRVADTLPLDRFADALQRLGKGGVRGRLVLTP